MIFERKLINVKDLCFGLLKKWKPIILFSLLGALIIVLGAFIGGLLHEDDHSQGIEEVANKRVIEAQSKLTSAQIEKVDTYHEECFALLRQNGILKSRIIPEFLNDTQYKKIVLRIDCKTKPYFIMDSERLKNLIIDDELCRLINEKTKNSVTVEELSTKVYVEFLGGNGYFDEEDKISVSLSQEIANGLLIVAIYVNVDGDQDMNPAADIIVNRTCKLLENIYGVEDELKIEIIQESRITGNPDFILKGQTSYIEMVESISRTVTSIKNSLNKEEKDYLELLLSQDRNREERAGEEISRAEGEKYSTRISTKKVIKYMTSGFVLAMAFSLAYYCLVYFFSKKLHQPEELKLYFDIDTLCDISDGNLGLAINEIEFLYRDRQNGKIGIISSNENAESTHIQTMLLEAPELQNKAVLLKKHPVSQEDFETISNVKHMIIIEQTNVSRIDEIAYMLSYYINKQIVVDGAMMIK